MLSLRKIPITTQSLLAYIDVHMYVAVQKVVIPRSAFAWDGIAGEVKSLRRRTKGGKLCRAVCLALVGGYSLPYPLTSPALTFSKCAG